MGGLTDKNLVTERNLEGKISRKIRELSKTNNFELRFLAIFNSQLLMPKLVRWWIASRGSPDSILVFW